MDKGRRGEGRKRRSIKALVRNLKPAVGLVLQKLFWLAVTILARTLAGLLLLMGMMRGVHPFVVAGTPSHGQGTSPNSKWLLLQRE